MSGKSIRFSIYSILLSVGLLLATVFLWGIHFILGIICIVLWIIFPNKCRSTAMDEAKGTFDHVLAKYVCPVIVALAAFGTIIYILVSLI